jgi:hypothetical protein
MKNIKEKFKENLKEAGLPEMTGTKSEINPSIPLGQDQSNEDEKKSCAEAEFGVGIFIDAKSKEKFHIAAIVVKTKYDFDLDVINLNIETKADDLFLTLTLKDGTKLKFCLSLNKLHTFVFMSGLLKYKTVMIKNSDKNIVILSDSLIQKLIQEWTNVLQRFTVDELELRIFLLNYSENHMGMDPDEYMKLFPKEPIKPVFSSSASITKRGKRYKISLLKKNVGII